MGTLDQAEAAALRGRLAARADTLRREIREVPAAQPADAGDEAVAIAQAEVDDAQVERDRDELLRVLEALHRLDDGTYGVCVECADPIEPRRLQALPMAERCARCQSHRERDGEDGFAVLDGVHRRTLVCLDDLETLIESVLDKGPTAQTRVRAARVLTYFRTQARRHHEDEERHVFPLLLASSDPELKRKVLQLQQDHFWLEEDWRELEPRLAAIAEGGEVPDLEQLRADVQALLALHRDHIALEEAVIYPSARRRIGLHGRREMGREMAARRRAAALRPG